MNKKSRISITLCLLFTSLYFNSVHAGDIEWSGVYRFEGNHIKNPELSSRGKQLDYGLNHLILRPKIVAGDGLTIYGQFHILNNATYPNSQMGMVWGGGVGTTGTAGTSAEDSSVMSDKQKSDEILVSQLYLTYTQEYGALLVGRAPLQFGLGITHNAGRGLFDHWYDSRDMVGYKVLFGNMYVLPMIGKASEGLIHKTDDLTDYMIQGQYENPETDLEMGVFYQVRKGGDQGSDAPAKATNAGDVLGGAGPITRGKVNIKTINVYALRDSPNLRLGIEASFLRGETGVVLASGDNVTFDAFAVVGEAEYRPDASKWKWGLKTGIASGDDPQTDEKFESYMLDRNYDVAMLLFNQPLGSYDALRSRLVTGAVRSPDQNGGEIDKPDVEAISNVMYLAPSAKYLFNDRWMLSNTLITGWLANNPLPTGEASKSIGYEYDLGVSYSPRKGITWLNQVGLLFPGGAWKGDGTYDSSFGYGIATKAAISF